MRTDHRSYTGQVLVFVGSVILIGVGIILWNRHVSAHTKNQSGVTQVESHDIGSQIANYLEQERYDDAVDVGLKSVENQPHDEIIYQQIALVYLVRAQKDPDRRERW